jgi:amino acid transporter
LELGAVIGDEIKNPLRNIPRAIAITCAATGALFLVVTTSLLLAIPSSEIGVIEGILQGVERVASEIGLTWIVIPMAILMSFNAAGNASAWLSGAARIPFVIGIDKYLPSALGQIHSKHHTPHVALIVQGLASSLVILMGAVGSTVHDMYLVLLQTTVVLQLIPYVYMFAALFRIDRTYAGKPGVLRSRALLRIAAGTGLFMTVLGIVTAFVPSAGVEGVATYELKLASGTLGIILAGLSFYAIRSRREPKSDAVEMEPT